MSEVTTATRVETVTANIEAVIEKYGDEAYNRIMSVCLQDISLSLAMLVDNTPAPSSTT
jgi:hypothetical protein